MLQLFMVYVTQLGLAGIMHYYIASQSSKYLDP